MQKYQLAKAEAYCLQCGTKITVQNRFTDLPCNTYCCKCCPYRTQLPCPKEEEFGTFSDQFNKNTELQILNAIDRKSVFIGYMMLCRYLNGRGYIRFGCNAGYPENDKSGNAKLNPCPILCPNSLHSLSKVRYNVKKLAKKDIIYIKTQKFYDSKNPYSHTSPKKIDTFTLIGKSKKTIQNLIQKNTLLNFIEDG